MKNHAIKYFPIVLLLIIFGYIYSSNFIYEFNDADDATTLLHHMFGRDNNIQKSHNPYDSMSDKILSFLPQNYNILFNSMVLETLFFTIIMLLEIALIIKYKIHIKNEFFIYSIPLILIFISPEIIYMAITFKTSIIGFSFVLLSQIIIINGRFFQGKPYVLLLLSSLTFAFGVSLRWNMIMYVTVIIYEIVSKYYQKDKKLMIYQVIIWGISVIVFSTLFIYISGYSIIDFIGMANSGKAYLDSNVENIQLSTIVLNVTPFFTPAFMLLLIVGLVLIIKNKRYDILIFFAVSFLPFLLLRPNSHPKSILQLLPALFVIVIYPFFNFKSLLAKRIIIASALILILFNWFVGIKIDAENTAYGPGYSYKESNLNYSNNEKSADKRIKIKSINLSFSDGFLFPTPEGSRPLYGHYYVLFQNKYFNILNDQHNQYQTIVKLGEKGIPILIDRGNSLLLSNLVYDGYHTKDPWIKNNLSGIKPTKRSFYKNEDKDKTIDIYRYRDVKTLNDINTIRSDFGGKLLIISFTYSSLANKFLDDNAQFVYPVLRISPYDYVILVK